jgi:hypothetical protein
VRPVFNTILEKGVEKTGFIFASIVFAGGLTDCTLSGATISKRGTD